MDRAIDLILASKSPRRRALLKDLGIPFRVVPSGVSEASREKRPYRLVQELAERKAMAVAKRHRQSLILGADTLVILGKEILGQPKDVDDAYRMLYRLSGTTHQVFTGVAVVDAKNFKVTRACEVSQVRMKKLSIDKILALSRKHLDKAGSYAIQSTHDPIAQVVKGRYDNVVGLPRTLVRRLLQPYLRAKTRPSR